MSPVLYQLSYPAKTLRGPQLQPLGKLILYF